MTTAYIAVILITAVANVGVAAADFARAKFVLANSEEVHVPLSWLPMLGALKLAGAVGLLVGLLGARVIGVLAATGLTLFFIGAVTRHLQTRVLYNIAFPATFLLASAASLFLTVGST